MKIVLSKEYALIVAGGKGARMKSAVPKQFIEVCGKPVLLHTIEAFIDYSRDLNIILVLPKSDRELWDQVSGKHNFTQHITLQEGGATRGESVRKGLEKISGAGYVAIHDGVRPLVSKEIIAESFRLARIHGSAVATVPLKESIRVIDANESQHADRSKFRIVQTPQTFNVDLIKHAYETSSTLDLTDDASVLESRGHKIMLFEGSYENIKITTPEDLLVAEALIKLKRRL